MIEVTGQPSPIARQLNPYLVDAGRWHTTIQIRPEPMPLFRRFARLEARRLQIGYR